jgi:hypothetical protein
MQELVISCLGRCMFTAQVSCSKMWISNGELSVSCELVLNLKFSTCNVVSVNLTLVIPKMFIFTLKSTHFIFNKCLIYTHDGASAKFNINSHETDYSVGVFVEEVKDSAWSSSYILPYWEPLSDFCPIPELRKGHVTFIKDQLFTTQHRWSDLQRTMQYFKNGFLV